MGWGRWAGVGGWGRYERKGSELWRGLVRGLVTDQMQAHRGGWLYNKGEGSITVCAGTCWLFGLAVTPENAPCTRHAPHRDPRMQPS